MKICCADSPVCLLAHCDTSFSCSAQQPRLPHAHARDMVGELRQSVSARPPRWIQITTAVEGPPETSHVPQLQPLRAFMDDILQDEEDGPAQRRSFTIHRGKYLLREEELVQEDIERPEVSSRKRIQEVEVDPCTPGRENWTLSRGHLAPPGPSALCKCFSQCNLVISLNFHRHAHLHTSTPSAIHNTAISTLVSAVILLSETIYLKQRLST